MDVEADLKQHYQCRRLESNFEMITPAKGSDYCHSYSFKVAMMTKQRKDSHKATAL